MADWSYAVNAAEAVKIWSHRLFKQSITKTIAWRLANISSSTTSEENIVQILDETQKGPGDNITYDLVAKLSGPGVVGDNPIAGQEEALTTYTTSITINQLRHSVLVRGAMSQQRVPINMRETARVRLADWWAERDNIGLINQLCGNQYGGPSGYPADTRFSGLVAATTPDSAHRVMCSATHTTEQTLASGDSMDLKYLLDVLYIAHTNTMPIKPIQLKGMEINGVALLHPLQVRSLKKGFSAGQWGDIQKAAMTGGQITGNPIFVGSIGMYEGIVIHEDAMIPYGNAAGATNDAAGVNPGRNLLTTCADGSTAAANVARGVFVGAQAACMAMGRAYDSPNKFKWFEELLDAGNQLRITAGKIYAVQKNIFNSQDFATITISSFEA